MKVDEATAVKIQRDDIIKMQQRVMQQLQSNGTYFTTGVTLSCKGFGFDFSSPS